MNANEVSQTSLSGEQTRQLQAWLRELDPSWDERWLGVQVKKLPPPGNPVRLYALMELVYWVWRLMGSRRD